MTAKVSSNISQVAGQTWGGHESLKNTYSMEYIIERTTETSTGAGLNLDKVKEIASPHGESIM